MELAADVKCYHCGFVSGEIIGRRDLAVRDWAFESRAGERRPVGTKLRCGRCEGPIYLEDVRRFVAGDPVRALKRRLAGLPGAA